MKSMKQSMDGDEGELHEDIPARRSFTSKERHNQKTADSISELWDIGPIKAAATLRATTQNGQRSAILPLSRRCKANRRYNMKMFQGQFATDKLYATRLYLCLTLLDRHNFLVISINFLCYLTIKFTYRK